MPLTPPVDHLDAAGLDAARRLLEAVVAADGHRGIGMGALELLAEPGRAVAIAAPGGSGELDGLAVGTVRDGVAWSIELTVRPERRGHGLGRALLTAILAAAPDGLPPEVWAYRPGPAQHRLAAAFGLAPVRRLLHLRGGTAVQPVPAPPGVTLRGFAPGDQAGVIAVHNAAFTTELLDDDLMADRLARSFMGPGNLVVAEADGKIIGYAWMASPRPDGEGEGGELFLLAVHPERGGGGLGRALLAAGLGLLAGRGVDRATLYVDGANTPAVRLYERLGFTLHHTDVLLAPGGTLSW
jgi:mycothiol synthase